MAQTVAELDSPLSLRLGCVLGFCRVSAESMAQLVCLGSAESLQSLRRVSGSSRIRDSFSRSRREWQPAGTSFLKSALDLAGATTSSFGKNMKTIASSILLGSALLVFGYLAVVMGSAISDNLRIRASDPMKIQPVFFVPDFMGVGSFMTTGWAFLSGILGVGLLLLSCALHLKWSAMKREANTNKISAEQAGSYDGG